MNRDKRDKFKGLKEWAEIESQLEYSRHKIALSRIEEMKAQEIIKHEQLYSEIHEKHNAMLVFYASEELAETNKFIDSFWERMENDNKRIGELKKSVDKLSEEVSEEE